HLVLAVQLSSAALAVLTTRPTCHPSLALYLSSHEESLPSMPDAYDQSLEALPSQPAASGSESHVPGAVFEAHNGPPDSILLHELKPLKKHRPPPPQSVLPPDELSYPP
ncbi:hypothetical protein Tco_0094499, partial [Tanacetum coccineum]